MQPDNEGNILHQHLLFMRSKQGRRNNKVYSSSLFGSLYFYCHPSGARQWGCIGSFSIVHNKVLMNVDEHSSHLWFFLTVLDRGQGKQQQQKNVVVIPDHAVKRSNSQDSIV